MSDLVPIKIVKVSSNDTVPLIYLPKEVRQRLDLEKGDKVIMYVDVEGSRLVIEKIPPTIDVQHSAVDVRKRGGNP
jgi:AbrB family looped-hinge helix DNA binding protein